MKKISQTLEVIWHFIFTNSYNFFKLFGNFKDKGFLNPMPKTLFSIDIIDLIIINISIT